MLKTICLYGFPPISVSILIFLFVKIIEICSLLVNKNGKTVCIAFRWRDKRKKANMVPKNTTKANNRAARLLRIYSEDLKLDSNFDEYDIQDFYLNVRLICNGHIHAWMLANLKIIWQFHAHPVHQKVSRFFGPRYIGDDFFLGPNLVSFNRTVVPYEISKVSFRVEATILISMSEEI